MKNTVSAPERPRWLDEWRAARGDALKALVAGITAEVEAWEQAAGARKRARKTVDQRHFEVALEVVVSNLAHAVLVPSETGRLAVLTGNGVRGATRYDNRALGEPVRALLAALVELGLVEWEWSRQRGEASTLAPTEAFRVRVAEAGIMLSDFGRVPGEETILLSIKVPLGDGPSRASKREWVPYVDTPETVAMRETVTALNGFLERANISFEDDDLGAVDVTDRTVRRHFVLRDAGLGTAPVVSFDLSGRLFGGFWQNMKASRRAGIRIGGEPVAALDYGQMGVRLAYATVGATPPEGDMYALPGLEGHRGAVKRAFNTLLNAGPNMTRWPAELTEEAEGADPSEVLPAGWAVKKVRGAVLARHPALAPCLGSGIGLKLMHAESEVLVAVLMEMMARGIVGLGIHDGLLTPASRAAEVGAIMEEVAAVKTGTTIPVTVEVLS